MKEQEIFEILLDKSLIRRKNRESWFNITK